MPTITLTGNANVSALTLANGDTIDLAGFTLTMNAQPTATGVQVTSPGTAGKVTFSVAISVPTWSFTAGTASLIVTLPANCSVGTVTGGTNPNANGVGTNNGTIASAIGGTGNNANGVNVNAGTVTGNVIGGSSPGNARGVFTNNGTITGNVTGGSAGDCVGVDANEGTIAGSVIGGSASGAHGVITNNGTIIGNVNGGSHASATGVVNNNATIRGNVIGGSAATAVLNNNGLIEGRVEGGAVSTARGVGTNRGPLLGAVANSVSANAVATWQGSSFVINGPQFQVALPNTVTRVYSLFGSPGALATIPVGASVVVLNEGNGTGLSPVFNVKHLGDFAAGATVRGSFSTRAANGDAITLAGSPAIAIYKDANVSESVAGVAIAVDFDGQTGYHVFTVTATDAFYSAGSDYRVVLIAGTVGSRSVAGIEVGGFSIDNRAASPARTATAVVEKVVDGTEGAGAVGTILHAISTMIEFVGSVWRWKARAMEETPIAVNVLPATGITAERSSGVVLSPFVGETISQSITIYQNDGITPIDLSTKSLEIVFEARSGTDVIVIPDGDITISGDDDNVVTFAYPSAVTVAERLLRFSLRDDAAPRTVYLSGLCRVTIAPGADP